MVVVNDNLVALMDDAEPRSSSPASGQWSTCHPDRCGDCSWNGLACTCPLLLKTGCTALHCPLLAHGEKSNS